MANNTVSLISDNNLQYYNLLYAMKDKIVQWLFYLLYFLCTLGVLFFFLVPEPYGPYVFPLSLFAIVIGVAAELDYFRPKWPVRGTRDYELLVNKFQNAVREGHERYYQNKGYKK